MWPAGRDGDSDGALIEGDFSLFAMAHTMVFDGPAGRQETLPWNGSPDARGPFTYASLPCTGNAPVNNVSTDLPTLGGALPGGQVPVSTRTHPLRFEVFQAGGIAELRGTITLTVCHLRSGSTPEPDPIPRR